MFPNNLLEPYTSPRTAEKILNRPNARDLHIETKPSSHRQPVQTSSDLQNQIPQCYAPFTPPQSTTGTRSMLRELPDQNMQSGLVQFINTHNRAEVSFSAMTIDIRCENYNDLIRALYEAACPPPGVRWGIVRIDVLWELPISMTTMESGNYRETPCRGIQGPVLRNILRLMSARGWRDLFVVRYIEG
ncbi:BgTH12-04808 [Blumeria graminis f. sp. triticale]|uniref:BgtAc-30187 n=3 Tax=Blumeria graminis TaxID=34373 RepID=A0A9X9L7L0_BLUGR|nr:hypothetical protein BGT96224_Ac30187 [Blumeria graminis f. sp. tritici 96224]CAD6499156.1 BgTH12-04808 [Blumeria graminis f. sp. triticale]VCU39270.1 BgtAc-30187 [Blumeria graminis f. sp. tritici]